MELYLISIDLGSVLTAVRIIIAGCVLLDLETLPDGVEKQ